MGNLTLAGSSTELSMRVALLISICLLRRTRSNVNLQVLMRLSVNGYQGPHLASRWCVFAISLIRKVADGNIFQNIRDAVIYPAQRFFDGAAVRKVAGSALRDTRSDEQRAINRTNHLKCRNVIGVS